MQWQVDWIMHSFTLYQRAVSFAVLHGARADKSVTTRFFAKSGVEALELATEVKHSPQGACAAALVCIDLAQKLHAIKIMSLSKVFSD